MNAIEASEVEAGAVVALAHGMTVATNALLERAGAPAQPSSPRQLQGRTGDSAPKPPLALRPGAGPPAALVPRGLRFIVEERMGPDGELPLDNASLEAAITAVQEAEVEAVAVCLLFAFAASRPQTACREALREAFPEVHVSLVAKQSCLSSGSTNGSPRRPPMPTWL